jgi:hypothetical protein
VSDRRVPRGNRVILTDDEVDRLLDCLAGSEHPVDRLVVSKLLSHRPGRVRVPREGEDQP